LEGKKKKKKKKEKKKKCKTSRTAEGRIKDANAPPKFPLAVVFPPLREEA
jgi:hypothetical protein